MKQLHRDHSRLIVKIWTRLKTRTTPELDMPFGQVSVANRCLERLREELECESK